jgi:hypothetical protein
VYATALNGVAELQQSAEDKCGQFVTAWDVSAHAAAAAAALNAKCSVLHGNTRTGFTIACMLLSKQYL